MIKAISLFSGAGGLDLGCRQAKINPVFCLDYDHDSIETLKLNKHFNNADLYNSDIINFDKNLIQKSLSKNKSKEFIFIGGPPCQPFSKNGYWITNKKRKSFKDPRNMIQEYLDVIKEFNPTGFLLENVESILHPTNKTAVDYIIKKSKFYGYNLKIIRANAQDYGVPQKRNRIFFIGAKRKFQLDSPVTTHYDPSNKNLSLFDNKKQPYTGVKDFILKFNKKKYFEPYEVAANGTYYNELKKVPPGKNYLVLCNGSKGRFKKGTRFWNFLLKLKPNLPSWTIPAQPGPWVGPFHWENRRLRVPEISAIQSFPDGYKFFGSRRSIQKQIGNAVPPLMAKAIINFLKINL